MSFFSRRILNITLLSSMSAGILFVTSCSKSKLPSSKLLDLQFTFSPPSGTSFLTDSIVSVIVVDLSPTCEDMSGGNGLFFTDTRIDKCTMTVNGVDSGSAYEGGFVCNQTQTQGIPLLHLPLQTSVCYGGIPTFTLTVTCIHGANIVGQGTATYSCIY